MDDEEFCHRDYFETGKRLTKMTAQLYKEQIFNTRFLSHKKRHLFLFKKTGMHHCKDAKEILEAIGEEYLEDGIPHIAMVYG